MKKQPLQPRQRKGRAIHNLLATAALGAVIWSMLGSPLPGLLGFRALERRALVTPTEIVAEFQGSDHQGIGYIGLGADVAVVAYPGADQIFVHPFRDHWQLISFDGHFAMLDSEATTGTAFLIPQPPEDAVSAQLTLQYEEKTTVATALKRDSVFLFVISDSIWDAPWEDFYEVAFFDSAGNIIETFGNMNLNPDL